MKNSYKVVIAFLIVISLASIIYYLFFTIKINFKNQTGETLEKVKIGDRYIGTIDKDGETGFVRFRSFQFDMPFPDEKIEALCHNKFITENISDSYFCGTSKHVSYSGTYQMAITAIKEGDEIKILGLEIRK